MKTAYFDCFSGISGDMTVGALIDAGVDFNDFKTMLNTLNIPGYEVSAEKTVKNGISGTSFKVKTSEQKSHRNLNDITSIIEGSGLNIRIKNDAISIFRILAEAEAAVHGTDIEKIHFHEVGAIDSIVDICGAAVCMWMLGIEQVMNSPVNTGKGFVKTAHGILPVPAPATAELLKGISIYSGDIEAELATPTGAAILKYYSSGTSPLPGLNVSSIGYGAGSKNLPVPNLLRIFIGAAEEDHTTEDIVSEIETSIDDMNPEFYSHIFDMLFKNGALDAALIPSFTKKNRPASILKILCPIDRAEAVSDIIFRETTTSGLRIQNVRRKILKRHIRAASTPYGVINVKIHEHKGEVITAAPEYEDCRKAAAEKNVPVKTVYQAALTEALKNI